MFKPIIEFQIRHARVLLLLILVVVAGMAYIAKDLKIDSSFSALISSQSEYNVNERKLNAAFEGNDVMIVYVREDYNSIVTGIPKDMSDVRVSAYLERLKDVFPQSQYVLDVSGPIYSSDNSVAQLILTLESPNKVGSLQEVLDELKYFKDEVGEPAGIESTITGFPVIIDRVATLLITDNLRTIMFTIVFIFLILYWYSRNIYFTIATISTPIVSLIMLAGFMVLLGIDVTITLAAVAVLMLGLGADYAIHISVHYLKARELHEGHRDALIHTISELRLPIFASFITTLSGFIALVLGVSPSSQNQGLVLSMGIAIIFAVTFIQFPILITVFAKKIHVEPNFIFKKILDFLGKFAVFQSKYPKLVLWIVGGVTIIMMIGASNVYFSTSNSNWIPDEDPISESFRDLNYNFGNSESLTIIVESTDGDLRDSATARDIDILVSKIRGMERVDSVDSPFESLGYIEREIIKEIDNNPVLRSKFNRDYTLTTITIRTENLGQDEAGNSLLLKELREEIEQTPVYNAKLGLFGNAVRFEELGESLQQDAGVTTMVGLSLVFLVASIIYASIAVGFLALIPIIIAVIWAVGLMGFFGVPFTSLSTGIISLVLGIGVDFSIHIVDGIRKYLRKGEVIKDAIYHTMTSSGKAILLASFTTFVGFMALAFASLLGTQRLGFSLAFSIVAVFLVSMMFVPAVMTLLERRRIRKLN